MGENRRRHAQPAINSFPRNQDLRGNSNALQSKTAKAHEVMMKPDLQAKYRIRARELRELAATMRNEHHRRLLLEAADGYEKICEDGGHGPCAENFPDRRPAVTH